MNVWWNFCYFNYFLMSLPATSPPLPPTVMYPFISLFLDPLVQPKGRTFQQLTENLQFPRVETAKSGETNIFLCYYHLMNVILLEILSICVRVRMRILSRTHTHTIAFPSIFMKQNWHNESIPWSAYVAITSTCIIYRTFDMTYV